MYNRFKFRVYIKPKDRIYYIDSFYIDDLKKTITIRFSMWYFKTYDLDDVILEQCTGLKDKNGVWIYEGDIIRLEDSESCIYHTKCVWNSYYKAGYYLICGSTGQEFYITRNDLEVIGNVHETPEFLEKVDD